jgi:hypothetical protein
MDEMGRAYSTTMREEDIMYDFGGISRKETD